MNEFAIFVRIAICQDAPFRHLICTWRNPWTLNFCRNLPFSPKFAMLFLQSLFASIPLFVSSFEFLPNLWWILAQFPIFSICQFREIANGQYCWFALDATATMLVVKNKSVSFLWKLNSIFMLILWEKFFCGRPNWPPCHVVANQELPDLGWIQNSPISENLSF